METTLEEARRCPKCKQPGEFVSEAPAPRGEGITRGATLKHYQCANSRCRWFGQICRIVQVNPDGTIPSPNQKRVKQYPERPDLVDQVNKQLEDQIRMEMETDPSKRGEIHRR